MAMFMQAVAYLLQFRVQSLDLFHITYRKSTHASNPQMACLGTFILKLFTELIAANSIYNYCKRISYCEMNHNNAPMIQFLFCRSDLEDTVTP